MIHVEILTSYDPHAVGLYDYEYDAIYIGRSKKNDLIFLEKDIPAHFMSLQIFEDSSGIHLVVRSAPRSPFFFINGKKISGTLKIYPNDVISIGSNTIKILAFKKTKEEEDLSEAYESFAKNAKDLRFSLDFIEEVLIDIEDKGPHV